MLKLRKAATPATALTVVVPTSVPAAGLVPIATVTAPLKDVAVLPSPSRTVTSTRGVMVAPAVALLGCNRNASRVGVPDTTRKKALVTGGKPAAVAVSRYHASLLSMLRSEKVATPATAATVVAPENVAPLMPVPLVIASVTLPV